MAINQTIVGVVLMTYGSATTSPYVRDYLEHVYGVGKVEDGLIDEFKRRYDLVGRSPLIDITRAQGEALQECLIEQHPTTTYVVRVGMLHSGPFISQAVRELKEAGAKEIIGIILSPQFSSYIMGNYANTLRQVASDEGFSQDQVKIVDPWPREPKFIEFLSKELIRQKKKLHESGHAYVPIVFTTHSLPQRVVERDPNYLKQLEVTISAIVKQTNLSSRDWTAGYQSAGHTPEDWLKPDLVDILADIRSSNGSVVLIVPIQFLATHLEIQYDLDMAAREQCKEYGIEYFRTELPNTHPLFIEALASIVTASK